MTTHGRFRIFLDKAVVLSNIRRNCAQPKQDVSRACCREQVARRRETMLTLDLAPTEPLRCDPKPTNAFEPIRSDCLSRSGPHPVERSTESVGKATWAPPPICWKGKSHELASSLTSRIAGG